MAKSVLAAAHFHDEAAAFAYLEGKLWPQGPVCPRVDADGVVCDGEGYALNGVKDKKGRERLGLKKCRKCRSQFTLRIGTIFEDSHAPLHIWLQAIALMAASKKGISSNQLSRVLGVQLKTAWHMSHRILGAFPNSKQQQGPSIAPEDQQRILDAFRDTFEQPANDEPHEWIEVGKPAVPLEPRDPSKKPTQRRQRIRKQSRTGTGAGPKRPPRERAKKKPKPKT